MKVLILGGSSFLGLELIPMLVANKHELCCLVRNKTAARSIQSLSPQIKVIEDITKVGVQDLIFNLIVDYGRNTTEKEVFNINVDLPLSLIRKTKSAGILNFSTALPEEYSVYSKSKNLLEKRLDQEFPERKIKHLKFQNFYGANARSHNFIYHLIHSMAHNVPELALTNCIQKRDFTHVTDAASGAMMIIENWNNINERLIDIGTGDAVTLKFIVEFIKSELGSLTELKFGAVKTNPFELQEMKANTALLKSLGWKYKYAWKEGIQDTIQTMTSLIKS